MKKQSHADEMKKDLDIMSSKINALEVVASGEYQKGVVKVLRVHLRLLLLGNTKKV